MAMEIERKFLVTGDKWKDGKAVFYSQGYLNTEKERTVRVRIGGDGAFLTIKGPSQGASRLEFEYPIPVSDAKEIMQLCDQPVIEKIRREITFAGMLWEVDEFLGENRGLVVAEIELESEQQAFQKPAWVGEEVTSLSRYSNSSLTRHPYSRWTAAEKNNT